MIRRYVDEALRRAQYEKLEDGTFCARVPPLRGVLATGRTLEACREELGEVVEEWVLVRVAQGLSVPSLRNVTVRVKKAS
jgi:predicted RNase H-like HicB family nuclease